MYLQAKYKYKNETRQYMIKLKCEFKSSSCSKKLTLLHQNQTKNTLKHKVSFLLKLSGMAKDVTQGQTNVCLNFPCVLVYVNAWNFSSIQEMVDVSFQMLVILVMTAQNEAASIHLNV